MNIDKQQKITSFKQVGGIFAILLLSVMLWPCKVQASSMSTNFSDLTKIELQTNLTNATNSDHNVSAHDGYDGATQTSTEWNHLGRSDTANDGVTWSVSGNATLVNGTIYATGVFTVQFQVDLWSAGYGKHDYDQAKAWVDWGNDGKFNNDNLIKPDNPSYTANDTILAGQYFKSNPDGSTSNNGWENINDQVVNEDSYNAHARIDKDYSSDTMTTFITGTFTITEAMLDSLKNGNLAGYWLRARSNCTDAPYNTLDPSAYYYQGETEDYLIKIVDDRQPTPEPMTMVLFGTGLAGLIAIHRRKNV